MATKKTTSKKTRKGSILVESAKKIDSTTHALKVAKADYARKKDAFDKAEQKMFVCQNACDSAKEEHKDILQKVR